MEARKVLGLRGRLALAAMLAFAGLALLLPVSSAYAQVAESEPNDDTATADGPFAGDQTVTGSIAPAGDQDFFEIRVTSTSNYRFETPDDDEAEGGCRGGDPFLTLFDSDGNRIDSDDDGGEGLCALLEEELDPGTYFIAIEPCCPGDFGGTGGVGVASHSETFDYVLEIDRELPDPSQCSDTLDNDSDGRTDFPSDRGCSSAADNDETDPPPAARQCSDGRDNDRDGRTDFPRDRGCSSANDNSESPDPRPAGQCTIRGTSGNDVLRGTSGADVICAGAGNDVVYGGGGNDTILGQGGNDALRGQAGNDRLSGGPGNDSLTGNSGNDSLVGGPGNDSANGGPGNDTCPADRRDARSSC